MKKVSRFVPVNEVYVLQAVLKRVIQLLTTESSEEIESL